MTNKHFKVDKQLFAFLKTTLKDINQKTNFNNKKKGFSYLSKLEAEALVKTFLFHKPNLALFSSYFSQEQNTIYSENFRFDPNSNLFFWFQSITSLQIRIRHDNQLSQFFQIVIKKKSHCILEILMWSRSNMN